MKTYKAEQWAYIYGIQLVDPDGWRKDDGVTLETPIGVFDFVNRANESTIEVISRARFQCFKIISQVKTTC